MMHNDTWRRLPLARTLTAATVMAILLSACEEPPPPPAGPRLVNSMKVADVGELTARSFPGRARAAQEVNRSFRVAGPLITFPVKVGDEVKKGDTLARIDPQDFETALRTLQGQLQREQARRDRTKLDRDRQRNIFAEDPGATSQAAIDRATQAFDSAAASVRSLAASVQSAQDKLSYTNLKAPFDGVVVETYVENFETVLPRQPILRLLDPSSIEFVINVPENLIGLAPYVEDIKVTFDALADIQVTAKVSEIGKEASQATRTYPVTLRMEQPDGAEILPGMAGSAKITSRPPEEAGLTGIQIPATAVFSGDDSGSNFVWIIDPASKALSRREVTLGNLSQFGVLITSGLNAGDRIVTKGVHSLREGEQVRLMDDAEQGD